MIVSANGGGLTVSIAKSIIIASINGYVHVSLDVSWSEEEFKVLFLLIVASFVITTILTVRITSLSTDALYS